MQSLGNCAGRQLHPQRLHNVGAHRPGARGLEHHHQVIGHAARPRLLVGGGPGLTEELQAIEVAGAKRERLPETAQPQRPGHHLLGNLLPRLEDGGDLAAGNGHLLPKGLLENADRRVLCAKLCIPPSPQQRADAWRKVAGRPSSCSPPENGPLHAFTGRSRGKVRHVLLPNAFKLPIDGLLIFLLLLLVTVFLIRQLVLVPIPRNGSCLGKLRPPLKREAPVAQCGSGGPCWATPSAAVLWRRHDCLLVRGVSSSSSSCCHSTASFSAS
mmetsp:Transcript_25762/g.72098  ORF Transcript_25762/g.72098 Transcript_25762/m.72098 type:complete len:270 (-) Transcript_25762:242-1051(-)